MQHLKKSRQGGREALSYSTALNGLDADRTMFESAVRLVEKGVERHYPTFEPRPKDALRSDHI